MQETVLKYGDYVVEVSPYPVDGFQLVIRKWDGKDWVTAYNKRVIADSWYEGITSGLVEIGVDWEHADEMVSWVWGIYPPDDEEND